MSVMPKTQSMLFKLVDGVLVGIHTHVAPSAQEWRTHCQWIEQIRFEVRAVLVFTQGGGPTSAQRSEMRAAMHELSPPPTAILTHSAIARGIVTAFNWIFGGQQYAAFEPQLLQSALRFIERGGLRVDATAIRDTLHAMAEALHVDMSPLE